MGDIISSLPVIRQLGGGKLIICDAPNVPASERGRESMKGVRYAFLMPLLAAQPYLSIVRWSDVPKGITHDLRGFRSIWQRTRGMSLAHWQATYLGVQNLDVSPWLSVEPSERGKGRVIVARSLRYHNYMHASIWPPIAAKHRERLLFMGLPEEHAAFERMLTFPVEHLSVVNALEMAQVIAGADMLVSNQTLAWWIGCGLGTRVLQETSAREPNSIIGRDNLQYTLNAKQIRELVF